MLLLLIRLLLFVSVIRVLSSLCVTIIADFLSLTTARFIFEAFLSFSEEVTGYKATIHFECFRHPRW